MLRSVNALVLFARIFDAMAEYECVSTSQCKFDVRCISCDVFA